MNIMPQSHRQQVQSDDDELGDILAGVSSDPNEPARTSTPAQGIAGLQFEDPAAPPEAVPVKRTAPTAPAPSVAQTLPPASTAPSMQAPATTPAITIPGLTVAPTDALEAIKKSALEELRPLVDKLNLPPEEKFDTLLLIIRSTDDQSLLAAAHEAAQAITDDAKRAEALLDVIKEIDYFSNSQSQQ